jgi:uroporphyrinogen-III synthase
MRVIVTRPQSQAGQWLEALRRAGHVALSLPLIEIASAADPQPVLQSWSELVRYDAVMFVSANAVDHFFAFRPSATPFTPRAQVTGPGSLAALVRQGLGLAQVDAPDASAGQFDSEALWATMHHHVRPGYRVLIVRGTGEDDAAQAGHESAGIGRDWFARQVQSAGGIADFVVAYQRRVPEMDAQARAWLRTAAVDGSVWLFSSSEALANLHALCPGQGWQAACALATHPRIAQAATDMGFGVVRTSRPALPDLLASIESMA